MQPDFRSRTRRELHYLVAGALYYSGILSIRRFLRRLLGHRNETCVLALHRVLSDSDRPRSKSLPGMVVHEKNFDELLSYLRKNFQVVSLDEALKPSSDRADSGKPACLLTFDDGWRDNYTTALPYLEKHKARAVIFLITGLIGTSEVFWVERLNQAWHDTNLRSLIQSELTGHGLPADGTASFGDIVEFLKHMPAAKRNLFLKRIWPGGGSAPSPDSVDRMATWEEVQSMFRAGATFGAHTVTHPLLAYEEDPVVSAEVAESKQAIEGRLGVAVQAFAYPNGSWDGRIRKLVEGAGFQCAFTTERGWHTPSGDRYSIPRMMIHDGVITGRNGQFSPAMLELRLSGWF